MSTKTSQTCHLLALPAELRNHIYELALSGDSDTVIVLFTAALAAPKLLLTCRQVYVEAAELFEEATSRFWKINDFTATLTTTAEKADLQREVLDAIPDDALDSISRLEIVLEPPVASTGPLCFKLLAPGLWRRTVTRTSDWFFAFIRDDRDLTGDDHRVFVSRVNRREALKEKLAAMDPAPMKWQIEWLSYMRPNTGLQWVW